MCVCDASISSLILAPNIMYIVYTVADRAADIINFDS